MIKECQIIIGDEGKQPVFSHSSGKSFLREKQKLFGCKKALAKTGKIIGVPAEICAECEKDNSFFDKNILPRIRGLPDFDTPKYHALLRKAKEKNNPIAKTEGCCGEDILKILKKGSEIAEGYGNLLLGKKLEHTDKNLAICSGCEFSTWLTVKEFVEWLYANKVKVLANFSDLTVLPPLPKKEKTEGTRMYCMLCKCDLEAKTRSKSKCSKGHF